MIFEYIYAISDYNQ